MSKNPSAYGKAAGDTEFRKTRDLSEYAERARNREATEREESKARYEAKLAGKKYYKPLDGSETLTSARASTIDINAQVGKIQLVPAGAGVGKKGRGAGFYCEACDLTFKDNLQWIEHQNSMQHLRAIGQTGEVRRAEVGDVRERIDRAWERVLARREEGVVDLGERLEVRRKEDEREREERRVKRREEAEKKKAEREKERDALVGYGEDVRIDGEHDEDDMAAMMGFKGFGTSKA